MSTTSRTPAQHAGRVLAVPLNVVFVAATLVGSAILGVGVVSNLGAERLRRRRGGTGGRGAADDGAAGDRRAPVYTLYDVEG